MLDSLEAQIIEFTRSVYLTMGWPGVVALMALENIIFLIPSEAVMPLSGWMLVKERGIGVEGTLLAGLYGALGCTIGALVFYYAGAWGGRPFLERFGRYIMVSEDDLASADRWFARYGDAAVFVSRMIPLVRSFISVPAGIVRMPVGRFTVYTFAGSFIWCWALALAGYWLGEHWDEIREIMRPFDLPVIAIILVLVAWYIYHHLRQFRGSA